MTLTTNTHNLAMISGAVGFLLPHVIALVNQAHWKSSLKAVVAFCICLVAAAITTYFDGHLNLQNYLASAGIIFTLARVSYAGLWRPTKIATTVEAATSARPPVAQ